MRIKLAKSSVLLITLLITLSACQRGSKAQSVQGRVSGGGGFYYAIVRQPQIPVPRLSLGADISVHYQLADRK